MYINYVIYNIIYIIWYKRNEFIEVTGFFFIFLKSTFLIVIPSNEKHNLCFFFFCNLVTYQLYIHIIKLFSI